MKLFEQAKCTFKHLRRVCYLLLSAGLWLSTESLHAQPPLEDELQAALVNRIDEAQRGVGIVVGLLDAQGARYVTHGVADLDNRQAVNPRTVFEVGSLTKVFTALLLADAVERNEMSLDDPVEAYLPAGMKLPSYQGKPITLLDLATHTSGLPGNPTDLEAPGTEGGYARYTLEQLYAFLSSYEPPRAPGETWEYSNVGMALLAHVLSLHAAMSYEELLRTRILDPLDMHDTVITLSSDQRERLARGHDARRNPADWMDFGAMIGAGGLHSTAEDLMKFAAAVVDEKDHPLKAAMTLMLAITRPGPAPSMVQHLGWRDIRAEGGILFHNGGATGFRAALAIRQDRTAAAVVLSNAVLDIDDLAVRAVYPPQPMATLASYKERVEIQLDEATLRSYIGTYEVRAGVTFEIGLDGGQLFLQLPNASRLALYAEKPAAFFLKDIEADVSFVLDEAGSVTVMTFTQNNNSIPARRTSP